MTTNQPAITTNPTTTDKWRAWLRFIFSDLFTDLPPTASIEQHCRLVCEYVDQLERACNLHQLHQSQKGSTPMRVTRQMSEQADAVQWLSTSESLKAIQDLLFPASPLFDGDLNNAAAYRSLGVTIDHGAGYKQLEHLKPSGWVVKDSAGRIALLPDDQFRRLYAQETAATTPTATTTTPAAPLGGMQATHPRVTGSSDVGAV